ncbi:YdcH family protein [Methylosinus sp. Sm6]|uniref:YdcH family protein n=1 Tax=Methylosinus sp. Sm6 TaxID=2866948 RepID=UPI001C9A0A91|nr:DUF465 domain-containing protein [Methylosinus sp. Sm6]MBY6242315.1 DUF465 domain-containing protein [Methylosinus sp. Sm6]
MSLQGHLVELERRHEALKKEIEQELNHRRRDEIRIHELKRKKLQLKDAIAKLRHGATLH